MSSRAPRLRQAPAVLSRVVGDEVIVAARDRDDFESMSETAGAVWRLLDEPRSPQEVAEILGRTYDAAPEAISRDVERLLDDLMRRRLIERIEGKSGV